MERMGLENRPMILLLGPSVGVAEPAFDPDFLASQLLPQNPVSHPYLVRSALEHVRDLWDSG